MYICFSNAYAYNNSNSTATATATATADRLPPTAFRTTTASVVESARREVNTRRLSNSAKVLRGRGNDSFYDERLQMTGRTRISSVKHQ